MAKYYFGINLGDPMYKATVATSTTGKSVEIVVDGAVVPSRQDMFNLLQNLEAFAVQQTWPPL